MFSVVVLACKCTDTQRLCPTCSFMFMHVVSLLSHIVLKLCFLFHFFHPLNKVIMIQFLQNTCMVTKSYLPDSRGDWAMCIVCGLVDRGKSLHYTNLYCPPFTHIMHINTINIIYLHVSCCTVIFSMHVPIPYDSIWWCTYLYSHCIYMYLLIVTVYHFNNMFRCYKALFLPRFHAPSSADSTATCIMHTVWYSLQHVKSIVPNMRNIR